MDESLNSVGKFVIDETTIDTVKHICNGMPGGFFIYRRGGDEEIIFVNRAMLRIFGCESEEEFRAHTHNSFKGIVHPDDYEKTSISIEEQIAVNPYDLDYVEYRIIRKDGSTRWVEDYGRFVSTVNYGDTFFVFIEDATERMNERIEKLEQINTKLRETHARETQYQKAILHNAAAFFEADLTNDIFIPDSVYSLDSRTEKLLGISQSLRGSTFSGFVENCGIPMSEDSVRDYKAFFAIDRLVSCFENDVPEQVFESTVTDENGISHEYQFVMLIGKNEFSGHIVALAVIRDITKINAKQKLFQAAFSEANAENIARDKMLKTLSDNIRTSIGSIISFTQMIVHNASNLDIQKYCLEKIKDSGNKLIEDVNKSMKITNTEPRRASIGKMEFSLRELLDDLKKRIQPSASAKNIRFSLDCGSVRHMNVVADTVRIEEILWQLLDNAVKFTDNGGTVSLRVSEEETAERACTFTFEVADNGIGMEQEEADEMFMPQPGSSSAENHGVGITIVRMFTDLMNGFVLADSAKGKGTTVTVKLPLEIREVQGDR